LNDVKIKKLQWFARFMLLTNVAEPCQMFVRKARSHRIAQLKGVLLGWALVYLANTTRLERLARDKH
jgi:hypothetical protein